MKPLLVIAGLLGLLGCEAPPDEVAVAYVVAREHGYARQAYARLAQADRDVRAFRDFERNRVQPLDDRLERILARRTQVRVRSTALDDGAGRVDVEVLRVHLDEASRQLIASDLQTAPDLASRLQRMQLPVRTSTESVRLRHEPGGWRVFLDLAGLDEAARVRELRRLKRVARARMHDGHLTCAKDAYEAALRLAPNDTGLKHALRVLDQLVDAADPE